MGLTAEVHPIYFNFICNNVIFLFHLSFHYGFADDFSTLVYEILSTMVRWNIF